MTTQADSRSRFSWANASERDMPVARSSCTRSARWRAEGAWVRLAFAASRAATRAARSSGVPSPFWTPLAIALSSAAPARIRTTVMAHTLGNWLPLGGWPEDVLRAARERNASGDAA
jgi:hypothetical protein